MSVTLPIEVFEIFERGFGREDAKKILKSLEAVIEGNITDKWHQTKTELKDEILKEVATKADIVRLEGEIQILKTDLEGKIETMRAEMLGIKADLDGKIEKVKADLEGKIERLNQKFNFMIILLIIALTLMNPLVGEIIKGLLKI